MGRLTREPKLSYTKNGKAVVNFSIAVNREFEFNGEKKKETIFIGITAWGKTAEIMNDFLDKGRLVFIEGRLVEDSWETEAGEKRKKMYVVAERFQFLEKKPATE